MNQNKEASGTDAALGTINAVLERREAPERRELRAQVAAVGKQLVGLAVPYNSPSSPIRNKDGSEFVETILPGAFDASVKTGRSQIENRPITFVFRHDDFTEVGDTATNLKLTDTPEGIRFELELPDFAHHLREAVASGQVRDMSFEFYMTKDRWDGSNRFIEAGDLVHLSAVPKGAYPVANVELRKQSDTWRLKNQLLRRKLGKK